MQRQDPIYRVQAAERLGVSRQRIHQMIGEGRLRVISWGPRGAMVRGEDVEAEVARRSRKAEGAGAEG